MINVSWSQRGDKECIRISGVAPGADVQVRPRTEVAGHFPPMAGRTFLDACDVCFLPRFTFIDGTPYAVLIDGVTAATLLRPDRRTGSTPEVLAIYPSAPEVPRNLLRFYVVFSGTMSEGYAAEHLYLVDEAGERLHGALMPTDYELWDGDHRRLTALMDPARLKRGLVAHRQAGYPIRTGASFQLVVGEGFRGAHGAPLRASAERRYEAGADERRLVEPADWTLRAPRRFTVEPLVVTFDRSLDYGLLTRCFHVVGPDGRRVEGASEVGHAEQSWRLVPSEPWRTGPHQLVMDDILEDVCGNSLRRVFDRDRSRSHEAVREKRPFAMRFSPR